MKHYKRLFSIFFTLLLFSSSAQQVNADIIIGDNGTGCPGLWDSITKTCTLISDVSDTVVLNAELNLNCDGFSIINPGGLDFGIFTDYAVDISDCNIVNFLYGIFARGEEIDGPVDEIVTTGTRIARTDLNRAPNPVHVYALTNITLRDFNIEDMTDDCLTVPIEHTSIGVYASEVNEVKIDTADLSGCGVGTGFLFLDTEKIFMQDVVCTSREYGSVIINDLTQLPDSLVHDIRDSTFLVEPVYGADAVAGVVSRILSDDFEGIEMSQHFKNIDVSGFETNLWFQNGKDLTLFNIHSTNSPTSAQFGGTFIDTNIGYFSGDGTVRIGTLFPTDHFEDFWFYGGDLHYKNKEPRDEYDLSAIWTIFYPDTASNVFIAGTNIKSYPIAFRLGGDSSELNIGWNNIFPTLDYDYVAESMPFKEGFEWCGVEDCYCLGNYRPPHNREITFDSAHYVLSYACANDSFVPAVGPRQETGIEFMYSGEDKMSFGW